MDDQERDHRPLQLRDHEPEFCHGWQEPASHPLPARPHHRRSIVIALWGRLVKIRPAMVQSRGPGERLAELPADVCPYHRPFPAGFDDCPAFIQRSFVAFDLQHRPLPAVATCRNLVVGTLDNRRYPQCKVGDAQARVAWAQHFRVERLGQLRNVSQAFQAFLRPYLAELYEAKGEQIRSRTDRNAEQRLRETAARAQEASDRWMEGAREDLDAAGLPLEACRSLIRLALERLVDSPSMPAASAISDDQLDQFPESVREFIRPGQVA